MHQYRKKPVVVDAKRLIDNISVLDLTEWIQHEGGRASVDGNSLIIYTDRGILRANPGDWVIKGQAGSTDDFYPCKHETFQANYEPAESSMSAR